MWDDGKTLVIEWVRADLNARLPTKNNPSDAGFDFYLKDDIQLVNGEVILVDTGIIWVPMYDNYCMFIRNCSFHFPHWDVYDGTIDAGYRGSIKIGLIPRRTFPLKAGLRIAQGVVVRVPLIKSFIRDPADKPVPGNQRGNRKSQGGMTNFNIEDQYDKDMDNAVDKKYDDAGDLK